MVSSKALFMALSFFSARRSKRSLTGSVTDSISTTPTALSNARIVVFTMLTPKTSGARRAGSWPLPSGLGGVVGDAVLSIPRRVLPVSAWATIVLGACLAALSILGLAAAAGAGGPSRAEGGGASDSPSGRARAEALARFDDEEDQDEPSFGMVPIGAVIHALLI